MDTSLLSNFTQADAIFIGSGFVGMVCHYIKKKAKKETSSTMAGYFGKDNAASTITMLGAFFLAVVTALNSGIINPQMDLWGILYAGLTTGFAVDSGFNSGNDPLPKEDPVQVK
jgi:hypothetical protein